MEQDPIPNDSLTSSSTQVPTLTQSSNSNQYRDTQLPLVHNAGTTTHQMSEVVMEKWENAELYGWFQYRSGCWARYREFEEESGLQIKITECERRRVNLTGGEHPYGVWFVLRGVKDGNPRAEILGHGGFHWGKLHRCKHYQEFKHREVLLANIQASEDLGWEKLELTRVRSGKITPVDKLSSSESELNLCNTVTDILQPLSPEQSPPRGLRIPTRNVRTGGKSRLPPTFL